MTEEAMFPFRTFFMLISIAALAVVIVVFVWLFVGTVVKAHESEFDRAVIQMSNVLANSNLTQITGVFKIELLGIFNNTEEEPYLRHCSYGYNLSIEDLENGAKWEFGYKPEFVTAQTSREYAIAVYNATADKVTPAKMTLTLYDTLTTRVSCLVEKAYRSGETQEMKIGCVEEEAKAGDIYTCRVVITKEDNKICNVRGEKKDCRLMDADIKWEEPNIAESGSMHYYIKGNERATLKAVPMSDGADTIIELQVTSSTGAACDGRVDCECRVAVPKACTGGDESVHNWIDYVTGVLPLDAWINGVYCTWNVHDGVQVKSMIVDLSDSHSSNMIGSFWEAESCDIDGCDTPASCTAGGLCSSTSELYGEKVLEIQDINTVGFIEASLSHSDDSVWIYINNEEIPLLRADASVHSYNDVDVTDLFHSGNNIIMFKAVDMCHGDRSIDFRITGWDTCPYPHVPPTDILMVGGNSITIHHGAVRCLSSESPSVDSYGYCRVLSSWDYQRGVQYKTNSADSGSRAIGLDDEKSSLFGDCDMDDMSYANYWSANNNRFRIETYISPDLHSDKDLAAGFSVDIPVSYKICNEDDYNFELGLDDAWACGSCRPAGSYGHYVYKDYHSAHITYISLECP